MNIGVELIELKQAAHAAQEAADDRATAPTGWFLLSWGLALVALAAGLALVLYGAGGVFGAYSHLTQAEGILLLVGGVASWAFAYFAFSAPSIWTRRDKKLAHLKAVETEAHNSYAQALDSEMASYGIEVDSITNHTHYMTDNYEFTARRNGEPIDVTVRAFQNEIVFMLNGERMQKPVTV